MKTRKIAKIVGLGLAIALAFSLGSVLLPAGVSAGSQEWGEVNTPSWDGNVIAPGSDIHDYAVGADGETIYAVGAIKGSDYGQSDCDQHAAQGLTGSFDIQNGSWIEFTQISEDVMQVDAEFLGNACYLEGNFTVVGTFHGAPGTDLEGALAGEVDWGSDGWAGGGDDVMSFSGFLYGDNTAVAFGQHPVNSNSDDICVHDWQLNTDTILQGGPFNGPFFRIGFAYYDQPRVWKSTDAGITWTDITSDVQDATNLPGPFIQFFYGGVAVAPDDEDWVAIAGGIYHPGEDFGLGMPEHDGMTNFTGRPAVVASQTGGSFAYAGDVEDTANGTILERIYDIDVSIEYDEGIHNIALAGDNDVAPGGDYGADGTVYRLEAGTWLTGSWEDASFWDGFDGNGAISSDAVLAVEFSPNYDLDCALVILGIDENGEPDPDVLPDNQGSPYLQYGDTTAGTWGAVAGFPDPVEITRNGNTLLTGEGVRALGLALPADFDATDSGSQVVYLYANAWDTVTGLVGGYLFRVDADSVSEDYGPSGEPLLASIDFFGDADTGKMMVGEYIQWDNAGGWNGEQEPPLGWGPISWDCCEGVRVWHTAELDPCCPDWELACKNPSGPYMALVRYSPDGNKAFASTQGTLDFDWFSFFSRNGFTWQFDDFSGGLSDESAFSVSLDDGVSFNQIGLIDTDIDCLSDVAVCPDCSVIYISTINEMEEWGYCCSRFVYQTAECDSVWRSYDDGDTWERVFHGDWQESCGDALLLRLPCEDTEDCCTLYLGVQYTDLLYYTRDCGQCWTQTPGTKIEIQDVAVAAENEVMVIDDAGYFSMSTQFGRRWTDEVDTEVGSGHVVESCCLDELVVVAGGADEPVAFSEDMGESWTLTDDLPGDDKGTAHVACDPNCPGTIYAAINNSEGDNGVYRTTIDSGAWDDLNAAPLDYYGIEVARTGGAVYAAYCGEPLGDAVDEVYLVLDEGCYTGPENCTGVARNLDPCETACCGTEDWDYLEAGLSCDECFATEPSALRICGCLTMDTPSILWAIDTNPYYDVRDGSDGTLWNYEDCTAKVAPELISPMCGEDIPSEPCEGCTNVDINLCWTKICSACTYDIEIATDEDFTQTVYQYYWWDGMDSLECYEPADCDDPCFLIPNGALQAGTTYYWHVRVHGSDTGENARSQWSETCSFNVMAGAGAGVMLLAPENGDMGIGIESVGFSWTGVGGATSYSFVLSPNSDLSGALASEELSGTAYTYTGMLDYSTPYFWQVTAWKNGSELSTSDVGAFTTADEPPPPPEAPPAPEPPPDIVIPPAEQITPGWIIAAIAIGAALVVVVIVLIVRTRRP